MGLDNGQISGRQCRRALLIELFGTSVFLMTGSLVSGSSTNCFQMLLLGSVLVLALGWLYWRLVKNSELSYGEQLAKAFPKMGILFALLYYIRFIFRGGFLIAIFYTLLQEFLIQDTTFSYIVLPLVLVCGYGAAKGREKRLRSMEMLFWFVFVPFALAILLVVKDVEVANLLNRNVGQMQENAFRYSGFLIPVALYSNVEFILFLVPKIRKQDRSFTNVGCPIVISLFCNFLLLFLAVGVLGYQQCGDLKWPALRVLQSAKIPGGFLERLDILLVAFWLFAVFSMVSGCIFYSGEVLRNNCKCMGQTKVHWELLLAMLGVYLMSIQCYRMEDVINWFLCVTLLLDIPLGIVMALLIRWKVGGSAIKKSSLVGIVLIVTLSLSGCGSMTDVEQWNYVLTLGIDRLDGDQYVYTFGISSMEESRVDWITGDSLEEAKRKYGQTHDKSLQLGHLAAVVLGESVYENGKVLKPVLEQMKGQPQIPVTISAYGVRGKARTAMQEGLATDKTLGEYLDDLVGNNQKQLEKQVAIKNLYEAKEYQLVVFDVEKDKITELSLQKISE